MTALAIDIPTISAIAGAVVLVLGAISTAAVAIINAIKGSEQRASAERQAIAQPQRVADAVIAQQQPTIVVNPPPPTEK